jgi:hypothetical protein
MGQQNGREYLALRTTTVRNRKPRKQTEEAERETREEKGE